MKQPLIACSRLYNATQAAAAAWDSLFSQVATLAGVPLRNVPHVPPALHEALWARPDLGMAFMCGRPFLQSGCRHRIIAAPVPRVATPFAAESTATTPYPKGQPVYRSYLLVREASPWQRLEDSFGSRLGFMVEHSHSGYNALRYHLSAFATSERPRLYGESLGPFPTPLAGLENVLNGVVDVMPMDSYWYDLCVAGNPGLVAGVRILDATAFAPMPLLVGAPELDPAVCVALSDALMEVAANPANVILLNMLLLDGFVKQSAAPYATLAFREAEAVARGYAVPA